MGIIDYIQEFNIVSVIIRMLLSTLAGAAIGLERRMHGKSAGVKTFSLVCLPARGSHYAIKYPPLCLQITLLL